MSARRVFRAAMLLLLAGLAVGEVRAGESQAVHAWIERADSAAGARFTAMARLDEAASGPVDLAWELALESAGPGGTSRSAQSGRVRLLPGQSATLSTTSVGSSSGPAIGRCAVRLRASMNGRIVAEDEARCETAT